LVGVLHESGHALAALLLQPGPVTVYLDTYGQPTNGWQWQLGRLRVHLACANFWWRGGYCTAPGMAQAGRGPEALYVLAGPLLPLLLAGLAAWLASGPKPAFGTSAYMPWLVGHGVALATLAIAFVSAVVNLVPRRQRIVLADGRAVPNDGQLLLAIWRRPRRTAALAAQVQQAEVHRLAGQYAESAALYVAILPQAQTTRALLCTVIHVLFMASRYEEALALSARHHQDFAAEITNDDRFGHALLLSRTEQHGLALAAYAALIDQPQPYLLAYSNRGYTHLLLGNYEAALADFGQVISFEAAPAYAYANQGLALLKLGQEAAGLAAIRRGLALDATNAYAHRNLGIYHFDRGEYAPALGCFEQAAQLDPATHQLAYYTQQTHQHLAVAASAGG
jgi:Flp pilus assembly protein TadD